MASPILIPNQLELSPEDEQFVNSVIKTRPEKFDATSLTSKSEEEIKNLLPEPPPSSQPVVKTNSGSTFINVSLTGTTSSVTGVVESISTIGTIPVKYPYFPPLNLIEGTSESDYLTDTRKNDLILARGGDDCVIAKRGGNDQIYGEEGNDFLYAGAGDDYVYGGNGNDRIYGSSGNDFLYGDSSNYFYYPPLYSTLDTASVVATPTLETNSSLIKPYPSPSWGDDRIYGGTGNDYIYGGGGNDDVDGGSNDDVIYGDSGSNFNFYSSLNVWYPYPYTVGGNDTLKGGSGNDIIYGEDGNDSIYGGSGNDSIYGGSGNDNIYGESGNDYLEGSSGKDNIDGGDGNDTIVGSNQTFYWSYLDTPILNSTDTSVAKVDTPIVGGTGISGTVVAESTGKTSNITAKVVSADNLKVDLTKKIFPIDPVISDSDQDVLTGGKGADKFVFNNQYSGVDAIADFNSYEGDQIQVSRYGFGDGLFYPVAFDSGLTQDNSSGVTIAQSISKVITPSVNSGLTPGVLKEEQFTLGISATDATDRFIYNDKTGDLFFDSDGNGSQKQVQFAQLSGAPNLTYKDIFII